MCFKNHKILVVKQLVLRLNVEYMQASFYLFRPKNKISMLKKLRWFTFGLFAVSIGLYPGIYFVIDRTFGILSTKTDELLSWLPWNIAFYIHIILGGISLLIGWTQFSPRIRNQHRPIHRAIGKVYVFSVLPSSIAAFYIAWFATGGPLTRIAFALLAILWFSSTLIAYLAIRRKDIRRHELAMIFSYSMCFAAVTLRLWNPMLLNLTGDFLLAYRLSAWLCWVPNLVFAILYTRRMRLQGDNQMPNKLFTLS